MLVALSIMAVMAVLSWRGIDGMARAQATTQRHTDDVLALQAGLGQWRADLDAMMVWAPPATADTAQQTAQQALAQRSLAWNGALLRVTRVDGFDPAAGVRVIAWARREGDGLWLRWQSAPLRTQAAWAVAWEAAAAWGQNPAPLASDSAQAVAVAATLDWQLYYYRNNAWTNPLSSGAEGAQRTQSLPDGVRLMLTLAPGQSLAGPLVIDWVRPDFGGSTS